MIKIDGLIYTCHGKIQTVPENDGIIDENNFGVRVKGRSTEGPAIFPHALQCKGKLPVSGWTYDIIFLTITVLSLLSTVSLIRKSVHSKGGTKGMRVITLGKLLMSGGLLLGFFSVFQDLNTIPWEVSVIGFLGGTLLGVWAATMRIRKWETALQREGSLPPRAETWTSSVQFIYLWIFATAIIGPVLTGDVLFTPRVVKVAVAVSLGLSGVFAAYGLRAWSWAIQKESEGFKPLKIPAQRQ